MRLRQVGEAVQPELEVEADKPLWSAIHPAEAQKAGRHTHEAAMGKVSEHAVAIPNGTKGERRQVP